MFKGIYSKSNLSLTKSIYHPIICINGYWDKIKKKCVYPKLKPKYNHHRFMLQNDTVNSYYKKEEISDYQKHINLIIVIAIIIASLAALISSIFLIRYIYKKCKKKKEEEIEKEKEKEKNVNNSKKSKKEKMSYEMSNIFSSGKNFFRSSTPIKKNKTFSFNPLMSSIKVRSSYKIKLNINNEDKIINNYDEPKNESTPKINNEYSEYTFRSNSDTKDNDFQEIVDNI